MPNPNNCETCKYHPDPDAEGHCYMFKDAPTDVCMQHSGREMLHSPVIEMKDGQLVFSRAFREANLSGLLDILINK